MTTGDITKKRQEELKKLVEILVIEGGGIKGLALGAIVRILEKEGILQNINTVIGSSVGGLTATMIALGLNAQELENYLRTGGKQLADILSTPDIFAPTDTTLEKVMASGAIASKSIAKGHTLYHASQAAVGDALGNPNATFADLEKLAGTESKSGGKFRNLELTATVYDDLERGSYQIVCSSKTTPNMPIALAMRMTASLPGVFPSVKLTRSQIEEFTEGATEPLVKYHRETPLLYKSEDAAHVPMPTIIEPVLSEEQFPKFPTFAAGTFNSASKDEKQKIINDINNDLLENSLDEKGELSCTDGGVVANLPLYLAVSKPDGNLDKVIAFGFETPSKKKIRENVKGLYDPKGKPVDQAVESYYANVILNPMMNEKLYYAVQNITHMCRLPLEYRLALLQKNNLIITETGNIAAQDFELETTAAQTHDQKVTYLRYHGYQACCEYLASKGITPQESFFDMYPDELEKAEKAIKAYNEKIKAEPKSMFEKAISWFGSPAPIEEQIKHSEASLACWEKIIHSIMTKTHGEKHDVQEFLYRNILEMREILEKTKHLNSDREVSETELDLLLRFAQFTEKNLQLIIDAKKECDKLFADVTRELSACQKLNYYNLEKSEKTINELMKTDPDLAMTYDTLYKLQESSIFFEELLKLIRDESVVAKADRPHRPEALAEYYKHHGSAGVGNVPTKSPAGPETSSETKKPKL